VFKTVSDSFPRQFARTQRLTLGEPRNIVVSPDGLRVVYCRSLGGSDSVNSLYVLDVATSVETCVADMVALHVNNKSAGDSHLDTAAEQARRERAREGASGIVGYSYDQQVLNAAYCVAGKLFVTNLVTAYTQQIETSAAIFDPRISPNGKHIAYVRNGRLCVCDMTGLETIVATENQSNDEVTWGQAEFVAGEEMGRQRGFWWSPDSTSLAVCRVDNSPVAMTWIGDPANPETKPWPHRYPFAGTKNADVSLHIFGIDSANKKKVRVDVQWKQSQFEYLTNVQWTSNGLVLALQNRDQTKLEVCAVDTSTGALSTIRTETDEHWIDLVAGSPALLEDGRLAMCCERNGVRALTVGDQVVTNSDTQVRNIIATTTTAIYFAANPIVDPTVLHVMRCALSDLTVSSLTEKPGMFTASVGGDTVVIRSATLNEMRTITQVNGAHQITNNAETSLLTPNVTLHRVGPNKIATAIVMPHNHDGSSLPILFDPYGGPHAQRVVSASGAYFASQWFANQGFCVVIADGRGTPGRGTQWERDVHHDLATKILEDQIAVLHELPNLVPCADTTRVGIRGWSFGGYLAALAVLRAPNLFHAAVAGAPVTKWDLYDTHYTERYMGNPQVRPEDYESTSLVAHAHLLERPLLLIHGLADDNVLAAHTLQFSTALLHHGKVHELLALSGVTHMTPQEVVAENLLLHQLQFLQRALAN
jgi:dipeptidyl-peptidase-4